MRDDSPTQRYRRQRALGAPDELALAVVLSSYGLSHSIVRRLSDGSEKQVDPKWTLKQVEALFFIRTLSLGGLTDGATRYPWLA